MPAILEFYFRFRFRLYHRNRHATLHQAAEFHQNRISYTAKIWRHIDFSRWRPRPLNTTSGFVFVDVTAFRSSKFITKFCRQISIHGWDITTSVFLNKRPPYWSYTSGFDVGHFAVICMLFCIKIPKFVQIGAPGAERWRYIHFSTWWPRGTVLLPVSYLLTSLPSESQNLLQTKVRRHITTSFFWKPNVHHIGILLPVSISTIGRNRRVILQHVNKFRPNRTIHRGNMTLISFFLNGGRQPFCTCFGVMADHHKVLFMVWTRSSNRLFVRLIVPEILRCIDFSILA